MAVLKRWIDNNANITSDNFWSLKYKSIFFGNVAVGETVKNVKIPVQSKYLSNF